MPYAQQLGRYQLLDRIAFGGMAEIFRAKTFDSEGRAHLVAVKRVLNHLTSDDDFLRMLVDEAKITATLSHENIARVYEFGHEGEDYFIAMEYVDGKDVRTLLDRHRAQQKAIPPEHVAWIAMEVAHALHAAHTQKDGAGRPLHIVHRDVSPSNVLLSYRGEVKLCDFGIAKATTTRVQTKTGVIKGKVKYMSPEQALGRKLDHRSDLFSLGTVMYEMLTLAAPFSAATEVELIFAVRDAKKRDARELEPDIPEELNEILNKLMSRSRSQRYQSGAELAQGLRVFLDGHQPPYRRSHFGRFMRSSFEAEIERELRLLEEYVIEGADPGKVGENLIADALGSDAPYTRFTAATHGSRSPTGNFPRVEHATPPDLHAEPTRILTRNHQAQPSPPLGELATQILSPRPSFHDLPTQPKALPELHRLETQIKPRPEAATPPELPELPPLAALETHILPRAQVDTRAGTISRDEAERSPETERQPLVQLDEDELGISDVTMRDVSEAAQTEVEAPEGRLRHDTERETGETTRDDSGPVPLSDDDLEPG
jgi:serine/threonine-protein kinase